MNDSETPAATEAKEGTGTPTSSGGVRTIFFGGDGLRVIWRLLIFVILSRALSTVIFEICDAIGVGQQFQFSRLTPSVVAFSHLVVLVATTLAAIVMARIEGHDFGKYGLPPRLAFKTDLWAGAALGFVSISTSLLLMFLFHGLSINGLAIRGSTILVSSTYWGLAFLVVGLSEEFSYRGYLQYTLSRGIGFWPAAVLLSAGFALAHARNSGENLVGLISIVLFGLLFCLALWQRGNLWLAVGFHAGWDWGETFFYGAPDSGLLPTHNLLAANFSGPGWLTGGKAGPEASIFTPLVLVIVAITISQVYGKKQWGW